ncbi:hypothetical protein EG329_012466 [Mollisiaceae sp. DMI_Dod_QoI]|nr:hypothetical protein EG329_012466 [Helotiales sp. DMI_Dod_QoI]
MATAIKSHPGRLADKVAVITGSSAGIGRAIALAFAREGAQVVCSDLQPLANVDIKDEAHLATHDAITEEGGIGVFVKADVGETHEVEELVHEAVDIFGRVDIFVNNAGIALEIDSLPQSASGQGVHLTPVSVYDKTMKVNARGTFLGCKYAIAQMMKQEVGPSGDRGWIINMSSVAGLVGFGGCPAYCSSKGAVAELTKQVAVEYGPHRIHVNAICPGAIKTAMIQPLTDNEDSVKQLLGAHPWGKFGEPKDVAAAAVFLASEDAAFVTGALLPVDGGSNRIPAMTPPAVPPAIAATFGPLGFEGVDVEFAGAELIVLNAAGNRFPVGHPPPSPEQGLLIQQP